MTRLGILPEGWQVRQLGDLADIKAGGSAPQEGRYFGGRHPFVRVQHLDRNSDFVSRWDYITDEAVQAYRLRLFPKGTIIFPKSGAAIRLEKRSILPVDAYIVSHLCAVLPDTSHVDSLFLFYALRAIRFADSKAEGYPTLSLTEIKNTLLPFPPLSEQRAIAYVLRMVQRAKEATERVIAATRELKKSLMRHLFTYGPVPLEQADQVPLKETEIGPVPEHWEVVRLGEVAYKPQYGYTASAVERPLGPKFLRITGIQDEQHKIACILRAVDRKIEAEENRKAALEALFKTLLHHLMTGKVRVGPCGGAGNVDHVLEGD